MHPVKKIVFLIFPIFVFVSIFSSPSFAGNKKWKKEKREIYREMKQEAYTDWRDNIRYSQGYSHDCNLPPGLAKKGKVPPGWEKKCRPHISKHHKKHRKDHYPEHGHKKSSGKHGEPKIEGGVDIGIGVHIPFP